MFVNFEQVVFISSFTSIYLFFSKLFDNLKEDLKYDIKIYLLHPLFFASTIKEIPPHRNRLKNITWGIKALQIRVCLSVKYRAQFTFTPLYKFDT